MANTLPIVHKRTYVSGRLPEAANTANTRYIYPGELSINLTDQKVFTSNGTNLFEIGSNLSTLSVQSISANGNLGANGYTLRTNGTTVYWDSNPGFTGSQGATGFTGSRGADGYIGADGYTGSQGYTGSRGADGYVGADGFTGSQGYTGSRGDTGFVGSQGIQGPIGYTGSQADATALIEAHEAALDPHPQYTTSTDVASLTGDVHGFVNRANSQLSYDIYTNQFSITPVGGSYQYYYHGNLHTISTTLTLSINTAHSGARFIRFDPTTDTLVEGGPIPNFANDAIMAYIYYNSDANKVLILGDERHGYQRDTTWHSAQHLNVGTIWRSGGSLSYTLNDANTIQIGVSTPLVIADEDLIHTITNSATPAADFEQTLFPAAALEVLYLDGPTYTSIDSNTTPWVAGSFNARYNQVVDGFGGLVDANDGDYITYWMIATNDIRRPVKLVMGRASHATIDAAYAEEFEEYGLSFAEQVFMYQIILHTDTTYTNDSKVSIAAVRKVTSKTATSAASVTASYHNYLTGRDALDTHPIAAITGLTDALNAKQDTLVSNTNIKTIRGQSILGSGDINEVGYTGSQGYTGSRGADGYIGADGYTGSQGYTGSAGAGFTGSQGITGFTGSQGSLGYTGSIGYTGSKGTTTVSDTAPPSPVNGDTWWNSAEGIRYVYYDDGTSAQWVQESAAGPQGPIGYTGSAGRLTVPIAFFFTTAPSSSEVLMMYTAVETINFLANFSGSAAVVGTNPASSFVLTVAKNGSTVGTITISTGGVATFATTGGATVQLVSGDQLKITGPASADASIANVSITLKGSV